MSFWDDTAGYDIRDPKHPQWRDNMADAADRQRKARKECQHQLVYDRSVTGRQYDGQEATLDILRCRLCGYEEAV